MDTKNFEEKLSQMTKPAVNQLKHQEMLSNAVSNAKDRSVVSWWWLSIPLYLLAMLLMKSIYMPGTTLISNIHNLTKEQKIPSVILFLVLPVVFILINFFSIRKVFLLSGSSKSLNFLKTIWFNLIMILFSILILLIYSL